MTGNHLLGGDANVGELNFSGGGHNELDDLSNCDNGAV